MPLNMFKPCSEFFADHSKVVLLLWILFVIYVSYAVVSVYCSLVITCSERDDFLALLCAVFSCVFFTFPFDVPGQVCT